jgi:hypothetical protein
MPEGAPDLGYEAESAGLWGNPPQFLRLRVQELKSSSAKAQALKGCVMLCGGW